MRLLRNKQKEHKEETLEELKAKDSTYKEGVAGGITGAVVGGLTAGIGHVASNASKNPKNKHLAAISEDNLRKVKGLGLGVAIGGAGLATAAAIKRRKIKSKLKQKEEEENANTEKK